MNINENTTLVDIESFSGMVPDIMERVYGLSLINQFCDIQKVNFPAINLYALISRYDVTGSKYPLNIITVSDSDGFEVNKLLYCGDDMYIIRYFEGNHILVEKQSENNLSINDKVGFDKITQDIIVTNVSTSRMSIGEIFKDYSTAQIAVENLNYEQAFSLVLSPSFQYYRKIKSNITREALQDLSFMFKNDAKDVKKILVKQVAQELADELDKDFVDYIKSIATKRPKLTFLNSISSKQSMPDTITELITNMNLAASQIASQTRRGMNIKFIVSPNIAGLLISSTQYSSTANTDNIDRNPRYIGNMGLSELYVDECATSDYYCAVYKGDKKGDATIITSPYQLNVNWHTSPSDGTQNLFYLLRNNMVRNPQDSGMSLNDSKFIIMQEVDINFQNITVFDDTTINAQNDAKVAENVKSFTEAFNNEIV